MKENSKCHVKVGDQVKIITGDNKEKQTLKGVKKSCVKNHINHQNYVDCIDNISKRQDAKFQSFKYI
jgi:ribosomal protein L24